VKHQAEPVAYLWWLVSRASGIVALILISLSVMIGLAMSSNALGRPGTKRILAKLHEHVAVTALLAIGGHGASLLGDHWLRPGLSGIAVPFAMAYRPAFTGIGIIGGYLALVLGPSFYLRRRIGARRWRRLHSLIAVAWMLSVVHAFGSGSDAHQLWLRVLALAPAIPIAYLFVVRIFKPTPSRQRHSVEHARRRPSAFSGARSFVAGSAMERSD